MPVYVYCCRQCQATDEVRQAMSDPPLTVCAACGAPSLGRVPQAPAAVVTPGGAAGRFVRGGLPLRREWVARNQDGSETRYATLDQARRGEWERTNGNRQLTAYNVRQIRKAGYVQGTKRAERAQALDDHVEHAPKVSWQHHRMGD